MPLVSRALERMRAVLFGPPDSDHPPHHPATALALPLAHPSPETWTAFPAGTPRRRARCPWPGTELPEITADDIASTLVGAYVLTSEARQQLRQARQFAEVS
ncbi:hypothetical protein ACOT81_30705 [Streptomyces sp. WI04-05B]|uniref:hypothetical protein n=1 Tax=Streptomyces TaxID=1883 RepID=UPI0029A203D2|nr:MULTISPECIES: hypothetical protein [unclassified Streptomyces]MDX2542337.1 hypothetical protein [Streptomyces sp. WI04-05B]MDX2584169.1 hypothetical protein [Streptomyces sp. WI04-05A]MDX3751130.1 hypothetical protein [Streptomyces sp. AK08-02]